MSNFPDVSRRYYHWKISGVPIVVVVVLEALDHGVCRRRKKDSGSYCVFCSGRTHILSRNNQTKSPNTVTKFSLTGGIRVFRTGTEREKGERLNGTERENYISPGTIRRTERGGQYNNGHHDRGFFSVTLKNLGEAAELRTEDGSEAVDTKKLSAPPPPPPLCER